jgi:hypothetical protein
MARPAVKATYAMGRSPAFRPSEEQAPE